jgi:protein-tyrosine-phosphatase
VTGTAPLKVLFVCTGNICRSAMAEGIAKAMVDDRYRERAGSLSFSSAGVAAIDGLHATDYAVMAARGFGADISAHTARLLHPDMIVESDLVAVMEEAEHRVANLLSRRKNEEKIIMLSALSGAAAELDVVPGETIGDRLERLIEAARLIEDPSAIEDPIGRRLFEYESIAGEFAARLDDLLGLLLGP